LHPPSQNSRSFCTCDQKTDIFRVEKKPLLLRFALYKVEDSEPFFFQHLIMKIPCYSEDDLLS
ncbi:18182_t:CDS:1, partial [Gigaspora rosea]